MALVALLIRLEHGLKVYHLLLYHRDPFDRILIAQSQLEGMPILTADSKIAHDLVRGIAPMVSRWTY
jgi:PIN domain nuclease of toxin-antitoxin system